MQEKIGQKNKEERAIFSETSRFCTEMCTICSNIATQELACKNAQDSLSSHPILVLVNSLGREKTHRNICWERSGSPEKI